MDIVQEVLTTFNDYADLLKKVITGDESGLVEKKKTWDGRSNSNKMIRYLLSVLV